MGRKLKMIHHCKSTIKQWLFPSLFGKADYTGIDLNVFI
uniref:Uncharacterized protein n=1 Tax=Anguilla anguilla TaxID=7936 RepID=A0A0E9QM45_ANGAN